MTNIIKGQISLLSYIDCVINSCIEEKKFLKRALVNDILPWGDTVEYRTTHRVLDQHIDRLHDLSSKVAEYPENVEPSQLIQEVQEIERDATLAIVTIVRS